MQGLTPLPLRDFSKLSPEEQASARFHEGVHRYDSNQQSLAFWNQRQREIDAYTKQIQWTKGQVAALNNELNARLKDDCQEQAEVARLKTSAQNYELAIMNAEEVLDDLKSQSGWQAYKARFRSFWMGD